MTKAYLRSDLLNEDFIPVILIGGSYTEFPDEWAGMKFECMQPDSWDEREWNLILVHPRFGVFYGQSIDWDFSE
jgi:hypothetical protein